MNFRNVYLATLISNFGSWLTGLGLSLFIFDKFGAMSLAWSAAFQILPQIIIPQKFYKHFDGPNRRRWIVILNLAAMVNVASLLFIHSLYWIYFYMTVAAFLRTTTAVCSRSLIGDIAGPQEARHVFRKMSSLNGITLAIAPVMGAMVSAEFGADVIFIADAITFLVAAALYWHWQGGDINPVEANEPLMDTTSLSRFIFAVPVIAWVLYLGIGAIHNAIDISYYKSLSLSDRTVGMIISCWGIGSFVAFFARGKIALLDSLIPSALLFCIFLGLSFSTPYPVLIAAFMFGSGFVYSFIVGNLRGSIQNLNGEQTRSTLLWAGVERMTAVTSIALTGLSATIIGYLGSQASVWFLMAMLVAFGASILIIARR